MISLFYMANFGDLTDHGLSLHWRYPIFALPFVHNLHGIERGGAFTGTNVPKGRHRQYLAGICKIDIHIGRYKEMSIWRLWC
jgi:hypothetical protein